MEPIYIPIVVALIGGPVMWFLSMKILDKLDIKVDQMNWKIDKIDGKVDRIDSRVTNIENTKALPELKVTKPRSKRSV